MKQILITLSSLSLLVLLLVVASLLSTGDDNLNIEDQCFNYSMPPAEKLCEDLGMDFEKAGLFSPFKCEDSNGKLHEFNFEMSEDNKFWTVGSMKYRAIWSNNKCLHRSAFNNATNIDAVWEINMSALGEIGDSIFELEKDNITFISIDNGCAFVTGKNICIGDGCELTQNSYTINCTKTEAVDTTYTAGPGLKLINTTEFEDQIMNQVYNMTQELSFNSTITFSYRLNMSELLYKGKPVTWVYQEEESTDNQMSYKIPCIISDGERYCGWVERGQI